MSLGSVYRDARRQGRAGELTCELVLRAMRASGLTDSEIASELALGQTTIPSSVPTSSLAITKHPIPVPVLLASAQKVIQALGVAHGLSVRMVEGVVDPRSAMRGVELVIEESADVSTAVLRQFHRVVQEILDRPVGLVLATSFFDTPRHTA